MQSVLGTHITLEAVVLLYLTFIFERIQPALDTMKGTPQ
jgi:hypothetical protein